MVMEQVRDGEIHGWIFADFHQTPKIGNTNSLRFRESSIDLRMFEERNFL